MEHAIRELSLEEMELVGGGGNALGCMVAIAGMGVSLVAGVTGPVAAFGFASSVVSALTSCTPSDDSSSDSAS